MIKSYQLFLESSNHDKVAAICEKYGIKNWSINPDTGLVDVNGSVNLAYSDLNKLPLHFGKVSDNFFCSGNKLTSLIGCPYEVGGSFDCSENKITSLEGCPKEVGGSFYCYRNKLTSLEGCPSEAYNFNCSNNKLTSLEGCPKKVKGNFLCKQNNLISLFGGPDIVGYDFYCYNNQLTSLEGCPKEVGGNFNCSANKLISLDGLVKAKYISASDNTISNIDDIGRTMITKHISFSEAVSIHIKEIPDNELLLVMSTMNPQFILDRNDFKLFNFLRTHFPEKYKEVCALRDIDLSADLGELGF